MSLVFLACSGAKVDNVLTEGQYRHEGDRRRTTAAEPACHLRQLAELTNPDLGAGQHRRQRRRFRFARPGVPRAQATAQNEAISGMVRSSPWARSSTASTKCSTIDGATRSWPSRIPCRSATPAATRCGPPSLHRSTAISQGSSTVSMRSSVTRLLATRSASSHPCSSAFDPVEGTAGRAGTRICDAAADLVSVNYLALNPVGGDIDPTAWVHNSMHPNERGHARLAQVVTDWLRHPDAPASPPTTPPPAQPTPSAAAVQATEDPFHGGDSRWMLVETRSVLRGRPGLAIALILLGAWLTWVELLRMAHVARQHGKRARPDDSTAAWTSGARRPGCVPLAIVARTRRRAVPRHRHDRRHHDCAGADRRASTGVWRAQSAEAHARPAQPGGAAGLPAWRTPRFRRVCTASISSSSSSCSPRSARSTRMSSGAPMAPVAQGHVDSAKPHGVAHPDPTHLAVDGTGGDCLLPGRMRSRRGSSAPPWDVCSTANCRCSGAGRRRNRCLDAHQGLLPHRRGPALGGQRLVHPPEEERVPSCTACHGGCRRSRCGHVLTPVKPGDTGSCTFDRGCDDGVMAIDFTLSPELEDIRLRVRTFVDEVVKPGEAKIGDSERMDRKEYISMLFGMRQAAKEAGCGCRTCRRSGVAWGSATSSWRWCRPRRPRLVRPVRAQLPGARRGQHAHPAALGDDGAEGEVPAAAVRRAAR